MEITNLKLEAEEVVESKRRTLWHNNHFVKLWAGQTVSVFGSSITVLALPLVAINQLTATPLQMGLLQTAQFIPFLLFGLVAGVYVDRLPRRAMLIVTDIGRGLALGLIPLAALGGWLSIELLYLLAFINGTLNLLFEAAYAAFLPQIVPTNQLSEGNSKLYASAAAGEISGPGLAGWLVQLFSAAYAMLVDAFSFVVSAFMLLLIPTSETPPAIPGPRRSLLRELGEGLRLVLSNAYIRALTFCSASANIFINMHIAIYVLYLSRNMAFSPAEIGLLFSIGSVGGLLGALFSSRLTRWLGLGTAIMFECFAVGLAGLGLPLATLLGSGSLPLLAVLHALWGFWAPVYIINAGSLRQTLTPNALLGRVTASSRFISWGTAAVGFLIGGVVAEWIDLLPTLIVAGIGLLLSSFWIILSQVRTLKVMPVHLPSAEQEIPHQLPQQAQ